MINHWILRVDKGDMSSLIRKSSLTENSWSWKPIDSRRWWAKLAYCRVKQSSWLKNHEDGNSQGSERGWSQTEKVKSKGSNHAGWRARPMLFCPLAPRIFVSRCKDGETTQSTGDASIFIWYSKSDYLTPRRGDLPSPLLRLAKRDDNPWQDVGN